MRLTQLSLSVVVLRSLTRDTCLEYGIGIKNGSYYFPYYSGDDLVAFKKRQIADKRFSIEGDWNKGTLFGQQLFAKALPIALLSASSQANLLKLEVVRISDAQAVLRQTITGTKK